MHYVSAARIKSRKVAFEINLFQIYNRPKMATRAQAKPPWYLMGTLTSRRGREEMAGEVPRGEAKLVSRGEAKLVSTSPSSSSSSSSEEDWRTPPKPSWARLTGLAANGAGCWGTPTALRRISYIMFSKVLWCQPGLPKRARRLRKAPEKRA